MKSILIHLSEYLNFMNTWDQFSVKNPSPYTNFLNVYLILILRWKLSWRGILWRWLICAQAFNQLVNLFKGEQVESLQWLVGDCAKDKQSHLYTCKELSFVVYVRVDKEVWHMAHYLVKIHLYLQLLKRIHNCLFIHLWMTFSYWVIFLLEIFRIHIVKGDEIVCILK